MKRGIFIVIYGTNNLGKSTQLKLYLEKQVALGKKVIVLKYPMYTLEPTGPLIFEAMKGGNPKKLSGESLQALTAKNRFDFQDSLLRLLDTHDIVIAEMYTGTGIAFGLGEGVDRDVLLALNKGLLEPDINILFDGERFLESVEKGHRFEEYDKKTKKIRQIHIDLAREFGWYIVNANQSIEDVHAEIMSITENFQKQLRL